VIKTESKYYIYDKPKKINVKYIVKQIIYTIQNILYGLYMKTIFVNLGEKKYKVSICAIFKNEGKYLREWIEFHRIIGIEHFYLYNNNSDDNYETVIEDYIKLGIVTLIQWPKNQAQMEAYTDCIKKYAKETTWLGFIDIDEFVVPIKYDSIEEFLNQFRNRPSVKINWNVFGTSGLMDREADTLVVESFIVCWGKIDEVGKCFYNTAFGFEPNCLKNKTFHHNLWGTWKNHNLPPVNCFGHLCNGYERADSGEFPIVINHYFTKSYHEYIDKAGKGDVYFADNPHNLEYFYRHEKLCSKTDYHAYKYLIQLKRAMEGFR